MVKALPGIVGVVTDAGGGLVPNAQVTLIADATGLRATLAYRRGRPLQLHAIGSGELSD